MQDEKVTITISKSTFEGLKDQLVGDGVVDVNSYDDFVGQKVFLRLVTHYLIGRVTKIVGNLVFMENASWVADTGRFADFIGTGKANEVEPVGNCFCNINSLVDGLIWKHDLPSEQV